MKKSIIILVAVIAIVLIALVIANVLGILGDSSKTKSNLQITSVEDLTALVDRIYEGLDVEMPMVFTQALEVTDAETVQAFTGLENGDNIEYLVASEPLMSSQAYSLVLVKVKDGVNANEIAKTMNDNINTRKWICVTAEKVCTTSSGNVVCLVMTEKNLATTIYNKFKTLAGVIGQEYERTEQEVELPADMY